MSFAPWAYKDRRSFPGVLGNALDCDIVVSNFETQSRYYVHFMINTLRKDVHSLVSLSMG